MVSRDDSNNNDNDNQNDWEQSNFLNMIDLIQNINMIYQQFVDQIKEITEIQKQTLSAITSTNSHHLQSLLQSQLQSQLESQSHLELQLESQFQQL
ncbi:12540_t:CDS:2, partial [Entrophospora sp. SA101]